jgi:hypothetical protein
MASSRTVLSSTSQQDMHVRTLVCARQWLIAPQVRSWTLPQFTGTEADEYRCFAAMAETRPTVREARWHNWDLLRATIHMNGSQAVLLRDLIDLSLLMQAPKELVRIHESGDFWTENYMRAWIMVAQGRPQQKFYALHQVAWHVAHTQGHHPTQLLSHCITRWDTRLPHFQIP